MEPIIVQGKYAQAKIFTHIVEPTAISQVMQLLNQPYAEGETVRMMPDIHAGSGCTIGTTMTIKPNQICPNLIGVDIGCAMYVLKLAEKEIDCAKLDDVIRQYVPSGLTSHENPHPMAQDFDFKRLKCYHSINESHVRCSLGSLGGGNHFIEANKDDNGNLYLVIHSGSRQLGIQVACHYQRMGIRDTKKRIYDAAAKEIIDDLKAKGQSRLISEKLSNLVVKYPPEDLMCCEGQLAKDYLYDMAITQEYSILNRKIIAEEIVTHMGWHVVESFTTMHNYIDIENGIMRKGAVSAQKGEKLLIPINMRDGSLLCIGKGNPDWNYSAPHGAGRLMSRSQAKETFTMEEYQKQMEGIYTTSVSQATLDECPMTYKPIESIMDNIEDTAEVVDILKPIYNFKAS